MTTTTSWIDTVGLPFVMWDLWFENGGITDRDCLISIVVDPCTRFMLDKHFTTTKNWYGGYSV